jgi:hypothetical protein
MGTRARIGKKVATPHTMVVVTPAAEGFGPWHGVEVDPRESPLGSLINGHNQDTMVIIRCVFPMKARGMRAGEDYLVLARFVTEFEG